MTIDEAIAFCHEKSSNIKLKAEPEVFIQLAELLEELKELKEYFNSTEIGKYRFQKGYNNAIDEFINECDKYCGFYSGKNKNITREDILKIAEQLKAGEQNEQR